MNEQQRKEAPTARQRGVEMLLFLVVSVIGIYALGNGLTGLFEPGKGIDLLWLAVAVAAIMILFAQMGRVHDTWPRRREAEHQQAQSLTQEVEAKAPRADSEEKAK
jgi:uncharacterized membrane protein